MISTVSLHVNQTGRIWGYPLTSPLRSLNRKVYCWVAVGNTDDPTLHSTEPCVIRAKPKDNREMIRPMPITKIITPNLIGKIFDLYTKSKTSGIRKTEFWAMAIHPISYPYLTTQVSRWDQRVQYYPPHPSSTDNSIEENCKYQTKQK